MLKKVIKFILEKITNLFRIKNIILFESLPDYSDNTKAVFDEALRRGWNKKYKLMWVCSDCENIPILKNIFSGTDNVIVTNIFSWKYRLYYRKSAKAFIVCNLFLKKPKKKQYYCDLAHGCALKNAVGYSLPENCQDADVMTISDYMAEFDAYNLSCNVSCMKPLGYARNDDLFKKIDLKSVFADRKFEKVIYWLPTYRQNRWGDKVHSDISMPIINNEENAKRLNECAKQNNVFIVVKIHQSQDVSKVEEFNLSNILFIKNNFFFDKTFTNYQLLGSSDAMLSDYSSVYYDYLLCDKPIGLCWDDFDEYNKREGFTVDFELILKGGEKIYNIYDLCCFVEDVANGKDSLSNERKEIRNMVHDHIDNQSTKRIVDYLETKIF